MTARLKKIALFGEGLNAKSQVITRQRRLNCYLEVRKDGDRSSVVCLGTPGLALAFNASTPLNQPARALIGNENALYVASGNQLKSLTSTGTVLQSATLGTSAGRIEMALNPTQVMIVDGSVGYVFTPSTGVIIPAGGAFPNGALTTTYCNGFFVSEQPGTNQFFVSPFNDGSTWNGLSFASAVQAIDGIKACDTLGGLLIIFSAGHVEFWQNAGLTQEPFVYIQNSASMYGLAAVGARCHAGDAIDFLANTNGGSFPNTTGGLQICSIQGYRVKPISNPDIDNILQTMKRTSTISDCVAYSYQQDSHVFAQFTFPTAGRSLLYDHTEGLWGETQTGVTPNYTARHLGQYATNAFNQAYVSDWQNGNLYNYDPSVFTDNGNIILREIVSRCSLDDLNVFRIGRVYVDMATGVGLASDTAQGYDPMLGFQIARDARSFGPQRLVPMGKLGQYATRVATRRWGRARTAQLRLQMTDPVYFGINSAAMQVSSVSAQHAQRRRA